MWRAVSGEFFFQQTQRVGVLHLLDPTRRILDAYARSERLEPQKWSCAEETVTSQPLTADDALEQKRPISLLNLAESADRRQRIADQLAIDRYQARLS